MSQCIKMQNLDMCLCDCKMYAAGDGVIAVRQHMIKWLRLDGLKLIDAGTRYVIDPVGTNAAAVLRGDDWQFVYEHAGGCYIVSPTNELYCADTSLERVAGAATNHLCPVDPAEGYLAAYQCGDLLISEDISGRMVVSRQ